MLTVFVLAGYSYINTQLFRATEQHIRHLTLHGSTDKKHFLDDLLIKFLIEGGGQRHHQSSSGSQHLLFLCQSRAVDCLIAMSLQADHHVHRCSWLLQEVLHRASPTWQCCCSAPCKPECWPYKMSVLVGPVSGFCRMCQQRLLPKHSFLPSTEQNRAMLLQKGLNADVTKWWQCS